MVIELGDRKVSPGQLGLVHRA